ncbi:MAG TPA: hypothetical protein PK289_09210 [Bacteroidia bacterium]|jgi:hypothetical protein|nr:hypothetical protein [Bacteroidia bacterium]
MKIHFSFICLFIHLLSVSQNIERKIIVQNNSFFYTTVDQEVQIGTLHTGDYTQALKTAKKLAIPAGRNFNKSFNPLSWDISDNLMVAVNFLNHPLNSKKDALKSFPLSSLKEWSDSVTAIDMILKSTEMMGFTNNEPYTFTLRQSNVINGFYFDGIVLADSSYEMVIVNNNKLSIWNYKHNQWSHSEVQDFPIDGYFNLFENNHQLYILLSNGNMHKITPKEILTKPEKITNKPLTEYTLVLNRDSKKIQLIKTSELSMNKPLNELIETKAISIF